MQIVFTDGLGNEMFQYAMYLALKHHGRNPSINIGIITRNIVHNGFELCDDFEIERGSLKIYDGGNLGGGLTIFAVRHLKGLCCVIEDVNKFNPDVFKSKKPLVYGYWQDERYFLDIEDEIRKAFTFRNIDAKNRQLGDEMENAQSVSLHIRRGDYLKCPGLQICTPSYYDNAIKYIKEHVENPLFYVFSDDLEWSEKFMIECGVNFRLVSHNRGRDSYKDMYLMTRCQHNIIANSSFSWWGAWLGKQEGKIVVCPNEWVKGFSKDPCPARWVRIQTWSGNK